MHKQAPVCVAPLMARPSGAQGGLVPCDVSTGCLLLLCFPVLLCRRGSPDTWFLLERAGSSDSHLQTCLVAQQGRGLEAGVAGPWLQSGAPCRGPRGAGLHAQVRW